MNNQTPGSLGEGVVYQDALPLRWRILTEPPDSATVAHWDGSNEKLLRLVSALDEYAPDPVEEHAGQGHELARLEFKTNLILELLGQLLRAQLSLPAAHAVRLNAHSIEWQAADLESLEAGTLVAIGLYLNPAVPDALELCARIRSVTRDDSQVRIVADFQDVGESVQDLLEKLIFRHHRRSIAQGRPGRGPRS